MPNAKRVMDILVGTTLAVVATPVIAVAAVGVMISLRTLRPFFVQSRMGQYGEPILVPKLRTLPLSTPSYALKTGMSFEHVPAFARLLRAIHIDELPQLFLVVMGRLSLVGPRPKMPDAVEPIDPGYGARRVAVPQGCTGLWQISESRMGLPSDAPEFDEFYVSHHSLRLDFWILMWTIPIAGRMRRQITMADLPLWATGAPRLRPSLATLDLTDAGRHWTPVAEDAEAQVVTA